AATARAARDEETPVLDIGAATAESDTTHRTREARNFFGLNGKGLKIGIISDSFNARGGYATDIATGDLPGPGNPFGYTTPVTVVQESGTTDEGRAMAQIIHDIVPGAQLFFATANGGQANFANNIRRLRNDFDCDIVVDDVGYFLESPLHKSAIVSRAVDDVVADGAMYFASAGNAGNLNDGTSGVWEGDFSDAGANTGGIVTVVAGGTFHDFDPGAGVATQNPINRTTTDNRPANLFWSDPLGGSTNDYDLYLISGTLDTGGAGLVVAASTTLQTGTQDPAEQVTVPGSGAGAPGGRRVAIFKKATADSRFLHLTLNRSRFDPVNGAAIPAWETSGQANGHDATGNGYATAATPAFSSGGTNPAGPFPGTHSSTNKVESFSSDGLRRIFYDYDNAPLNSNLSATGGAVLQKPEITAADGVQTTVPGFQPFFGTSAAAPTAAAVAALLQASNPAITRDQILPALTSTAIDIEAAGFDRDSGFGIISPFAALQSLNAQAGATLDIGTVTFTPTSGCDSGFDAGERGTVTVALNNLGGAGATAISATLVSQTPGVTVVQSTSGYPDINSTPSSATNLRPFTVQTEPGAVACGAKLKFSLAVTFVGGQASPAVFPITVQTAGAPGATPTNVAYSGPPAAIPDGNAAGVNIPLAVSGFSGSVSDLNFRIGGSACNATAGATTNGVNHTWVGDLVFKLTSPSGTTVTVINQAGGVNNSGNNFCNTVLDDDTANGSIQSVTAAQNPYTNTFKPANLLSAFDGENPNGTWTLNVADLGTPDTGNVTAFSLDISEFSCAAVPTTTISGRVADGGGNGVDAVSVSLTGTEQQATTTDANGDYSFTLSTCGGIYTVTPSKAGHTFAPPQATFVNVAGSQTANFTAAAAVTPSGTAAGQVVISEFRARGAAGALDEFVEIANRTDSAITVGASDGSSGGWLLAALNTDGTSSTPVYTIPNGTVIPARGRYLVAGRGYTLGGYAAGDAYSTADIPDNTGLALFDSGTTSGAVLDAAGFNTAGAGFADTYREGGGMPPVGTTNGQYSLLRDLVTGTPRDTGSNADDFILVAPDAGTYGGRQSRLGAPGPENTGSPVNRNDRIKATLIDIAQSNGAAPNVVRDFTSYDDALTPTTAGPYTAGTFSIRRRFTNQSADPVSRLRFRIADLTAGPAAAGTADLRLLSSPELLVSVSDMNCAAP
ncbi:MAG TPA: proprotein convertase P-domain-containing protein, partial [Pyrinomonadaceae bacterium]